VTEFSRVTIHATTFLRGPGPGVLYSLLALKSRDHLAVNTVLNFAQGADGPMFATYVGMTEIEHG